MGEELAANQPPLEAELMPQPPETPQEPTIEQQEQELAALQNELAQSEASLEADFAKWCSQNLTAEDEELFFENKEAFVQNILQKQNAFIQEQLAGKMQRAKALQTEIGERKTFAEIENAQNAFLQKHPDADMNALKDFYLQDLPPRYRAELEKLNGADFFEALLQAYQAYNGGEQVEQELPQRVSGNGSVADVAGMQNSVMQRF